MTVIFIENQRMYYFECPNCEGLCQVPKKNIKCGIFRHAIYKYNGKYIEPHTSEDECNRLTTEKLIYGCGKPFKFDGKTVEICGYI